MAGVRDSFQRAGRWVKRCARPLEAARWEYAFEGGSRAAVLRILEAYQNSDGGFGHGLEPDFWLPDSAPMATWAAARILREVGATAEATTVQRLLQYLCRTQGANGLWAAVVPGTNDFPHAPWWEWSEGTNEKWGFNPSVELGAFLIHWSLPGSEAAERGWQTVFLAVQRLLSCTEMDMHEISNYAAAVELLSAQPAECARRTGYALDTIQAKVGELALASVDPDPSQWAGRYCALPLSYVSGPESFLYPVFGRLVEENLAFFASQADEDGLWPVNWEWGAYPAQFAVAERQWRGIIALERYRIFQAFGWL